MDNLTHRPKGFTIVELLIVIVVIGILAAISIVSYNGIQNRANDTAVKNDLANMAKKIHLTSAETGTFIEGGSVSVGDSTQFPGFVFSPSKESYHTDDGLNLIYCTGITTDGNNGFAIMARSKSRQTFKYSSLSGISKYTQTPSTGRACEEFDSATRSHSYGYYGVGENNVWRGWTN